MSLYRPEYLLLSTWIDIVIVRKSGPIILDLARIMEYWPVRKLLLADDHLSYIKNPSSSSKDLQAAEAEIFNH